MPNLPAPYVSPWRELGRNLRAAQADLRLRIQTLWRRNREGDFPRPAFWPQDLAPLFWPLSLLGFLLLSIVLTALLINGPGTLRQQQPASPSQNAEARVPADQSSDQQFNVRLSEADPHDVDRDQILPDLPSADRDRNDIVIEQDAPVSDTVQGLESIESEQALGSEPQALASEPDVPRSSVQNLADPLFQALQDAAGAGFAELVLEANPIVDLNSMVVVLSSDAWSFLPDLERNHLAMQWEALVLDFGYGELMLVDQDDRPLGRSARVGEGMILFRSESKA